MFLFLCVSSYPSHPALVKVLNYRHLIWFSLFLFQYFSLTFSLLALSYFPLKHVAYKLALLCFGKNRCYTAADRVLLSHLRYGNGVRTWEILLKSDGIRRRPSVSSDLNSNNASGEESISPTSHVFHHQWQFITATHLWVQGRSSWGRISTLKIEKIIFYLRKSFMFILSTDIITKDSLTYCVTFYPSTIHKRQTDRKKSSCCKNGPDNNVKHANTM